VNLHGSVRLARLAKEAGVPRYLFASSCSIYGKGVKLDLDESSELQPLSAYAVSKVETEKQVSTMAAKDFSPVFLRNATAYGYSRNLRIDLVANNLLACAFARGDIRIDSDGTPWRPLTHCRDIARAFIAFATAPREAVHNRAVNIGANDQNYQVKDIADRVKRLIPNADVVFTGKTGADPRNYRVAFDLLDALLPGFRLAYNLDTGLDELCRKFREHGFSVKDFDGERFVRLRTLKKRMALVQR
jgi:nucleoside-diphosphate-sugar epimerase